MPVSTDVDLTEHHKKIFSSWQPYYASMPKVDNQGNLYFIMPMTFTWAIVCNADHNGYSHRFCYENLTECLDAYDRWTPSLETEPPNFIARK